MLDDLRQRAAVALSAPAEAILITYGPAGLQAARVPCATSGLRLYALVLRTSDLLFNLEQQPEVLVVAPHWQLRGTAGLPPPEDLPAELELPAAPDAPWCAVVAIMPTRLHILDDGVAQRAETIDL
jgi:hypothetical protein